MGLAAGVIGAATIGAVGSVASGLIGSSAAKNAASVQAQSDANALAVQQQENAAATAQQQAANDKALGIESANQKQALGLETSDQNAATKALAPYADIGLGATKQIADLYGIGYAGQGNGSATTSANGVVTPANSNAASSSAGGNAVEQAAQTQFTKSPDYEFAFNQGLQALDRSAAASGTLQSGGQTKAALEFGQGLASQQYGNYFNRLQSLSGIGQSAAKDTAAANLSAGATQGGTLTSSGATQGNTLVSGGQILGNQMQSGANAEANTLMGQGTALASGIVGSGNALSGAATGVGSSAMNALLISKLGTQSPSAYGANSLAGYNASTSNYGGMTGLQQDALQDTGFALP